MKTGEINRMRPRLLTAAIGTEARRTGYLHGLPSQGVDPLLEAITQAVHTPLVLRVVFGASTQVPLRALSYVLPAVWMAERLTATGLRPPQLHVILAGSLGAEIASLPGRDVDEETKLLAGSLDRMLAVLAPGRYGIYRTLPGTTGDLHGRLRQLVNALAPAQRAHVLDRLDGKGGSTSPDTTLLYAAAHVLLHDRAAVPLVLDSGHPAPENPVVIDIGGLQERHFYQARRLFTSAMGISGPGSLILSRHSVPPYTMARGGDIGLSQFLRSGQVSEMPGVALAPAAEHDLRLLEQINPLALLHPPVAARRRVPA
ncbi:hypothetical protein [Streptomyces griseorubiginosus]|uniref:hypothetical protein n=1 Tax=Streptomyces griseorubiginosus TaxID=67304 RepID=UPI0036E0BD2A